MDGELPLRPMTVGELLDASVVLLRRSWPPLVALGLLLSAGQLALLVLAVGPPPAPVFDSPYWFVWGAGLWNCLSSTGYDLCNAHLPPTRYCMGS